MSGGTNGTDLVITFNSANATPARVQALLEHIGYANSSGTPSPQTREVIGTVELNSGRFVPVAFCPGYLRGLTFLGDYALVGLSEPRDNKTFAGLPLQERLTAAKVEPRCAIYVIDTRTGDVAHWLRIEGVVNELYDVVALPKAKRPMLIGFRSQEIRRMISIEA